MAGRNSFTNLLEFAATVGSFVPNPWIKGISILTGIIISSLPTKRPKAMTESQSYGWEHAANKTAANGTPLAVVYGKTRVKPVLKNRYILMDGDRQWLYALYSFTGHALDIRTVQIDGVTPLIAWAAGTTYAAGAEVKEANHPGRTFICKYPHTAHASVEPLFVGNFLNINMWRAGPGQAAITDIKINGNSIGDFDPGAISYETRPGTPIQDIIEGFHVTYQNNYQGLALKPYVLEWNSSATYIVGEMAWKSVSGNIHIYSCVARSHNNTPPNASYWDDLGITGGLANVNLYPAAYFTQATTVTATGTRLLVDINFPRGLYHSYADGGTRVYPHSVSVRIWFKKAAEGWDKSVCVNGGSTLDYRVTRESTQAFHWSFIWPKENQNPLALGAYDVRIEYIASKPANPGASPYTEYYEHTAELSNIASLVYADFTYPGESLLGIKVLATEKLQGDIEVTAVCERSKVWVRDGTNTYPNNLGWNKLAANNHAWAIYDLLVQGNSAHPSYNNVDWTEDMPPYGCGITYSRVDYASFKIWADFIDTLTTATTPPPVGYKLNIVFDDFSTIWDAIIMIAFEGRGSVLPYGAQYYAIPDKASAAVALICEGNIVANSLTQAWGDKSKRANSMEVTYKDALRSYDDVTFIVRTAEWATDASLTDATRQTLYGTTFFDQAYRIAKYFLNCNETLMRLVNLEMDVEGLEIAAGDVVNLQHAMMGIGTGGRIVGYEENLLWENPSFEHLPTGLEHWTLWDNAAGIARVRSADIAYDGTYSWFHHSVNAGYGLQRTITTLPSTTYTISIYCYIPYLLGSDSLRIQSHDDQAETHYVYGYADLTKLNQWQRVTLTLTTASNQNHITMWIGAIGRCYWDAAMLEKAAAATTWKAVSKISMDRSVTLAPATTYGVTIRNAAGVLETHTDTTVTGTVTAIEFASLWANAPEAYSPYAFGVSPTYMKLFRVIEANRSGDMKKRLTLLEYSASVYADATLPDIGVDPATGAYKPPPLVFNDAANLTLSEFTSRRPTGEYQSNIVVSWTPEDMAAWGQWEVVFRDVTAGDPNWKGEWAAGSYDMYEKVTKDGKAYISLTDGNTGTPFSI